MVDFIVECSYREHTVKKEEVEWKLYINGAANRGVTSAEIVLKGLNRVFIEYVLRLAFKVTNNIVEYRALSKGLDLAREMKPKKLNVNSDSQLVTSQDSGQFETKEEKMVKYQKKVQE